MSTFTVDDFFLINLSERLRTLQRREDSTRPEIRSVQTLINQLDTVASPQFLSQLRRLETRTIEVERILNDETRPVRTPTIGC